jgi:hypothetical protein
MRQKKKLISNKLRNEGYVVIKDFLKRKDLDDNFLNYLKKKDKFVDGVIHGIDDKFYKKINNKINFLVSSIRSKDLKISDNKFCYFSIKIKKSINKKPKLIKPFNIFKDPKVLPGGVLNWHIDHYTYYFHKDHKNYLICYLPIFKPSKNYSNVALIPYNILKKKDLKTFNRIKHRGAIRFRKVESDTKPWFDLRFKKKTKVGNWFALDDYLDDVDGWKMNLDLEKNKVVPKLNLYDLLVMRADVIHKTNDAITNRIAIRCDILPEKAIYEQSFIGFINICLKYFFETSKAKYNLKRYIKNYINKALKYG